jgi:hypothetical protein
MKRFFSNPQIIMYIILFELTKQESSIKVQNVEVDEETMLDELEVGQNVTVWYGGPFSNQIHQKSKG